MIREERLYKKNLAARKLEYMEDDRKRKTPIAGLKRRDPSKPLPTIRNLWHRVKTNDGQEYWERYI